MCGMHFHYMKSLLWILGSWSVKYNIIIKAFQLAFGLSIKTLSPTFWLSMSWCWLVNGFNMMLWNHSSWYLYSDRNESITCYSCAPLSNSPRIKKINTYKIIFSVYCLIYERFGKFKYNLLQSRNKVRQYLLRDNWISVYTIPGIRLVLHFNKTIHTRYPFCQWDLYYSFQLFQLTK